jgi:hypothetical protein
MNISFKEKEFLLKRYNKDKKDYTFTSTLLAP